MSIVEKPPYPDGQKLTEQNPHFDTIRQLPDKGLYVVEAADGQTSFLRQGIIRTGGAEVKYTVETPYDLTDPIPLIVAPGFTGIKPAYRELRRNIVAHGKPAATFEPPRRQAGLSGLHPKHLLHPERLLAQSVLAVSKDVINIEGRNSGFDQVDAVGHSMGGPAVTKAALLRPERFRSVTLMGSAGLDGHTIWDMIGRSPSVLAGEILPSLKDTKVEKSLRSLGHFVNYFVSNPLRTAGEALAVSNADIRDEVRHLGSIGVWTATQQFARDGFFPLKGVREQSEDIFGDNFYTLPDLGAGHMAPQNQPGAVAEHLIYILRNLEESQRQKTA